MEEESITKKEYEKHKLKCNNNFDSLGAKMDKMELAMYGNPELEMSGVLQMTKEMHAVFVGSGFTFKTVLKILALITATGTAITFLWKLIFFKSN